MGRAQHVLQSGCFAFHRWECRRVDSIEVCVKFRVTATVATSWLQQKKQGWLPLNHVEILVPSKRGASKQKSPRPFGQLASLDPTRLLSWRALRKGALREARDASHVAPIRCPKKNRAKGEQETVFFFLRGPPPAMNRTEQKQKT